MKSGTVILNVDRRDASRSATNRVLRQAGYDVAEAANGAEALRAVETKKPHVVILDGVFPDMDGFELCQRIKSRPAPPAALLLHTPDGGVNNAHLLRGLESGADGSLVEPVEPAVLLAVVQSLLRRREAEDHIRADVEHARAEAEVANRTKDEFLATVSHELRSPLNALLTWTHLLRSGKLQEGATVRALDGIERSTKLQTQLIDDLLDASRIISGKLRLGMRPVELSAVIEAAVQSVRVAAERKSIRIEMSLDRDAAPVHGDPSRLQQVVDNLLSNAIKFSPNGGRVAVELAQSGSDVQITVSDDGEGIAPELLPQIFDRFRQGDVSTTRRHGGLGLGLAIVRHLIELHGGRVAAASPGPSQGAVFTVTLPVMAMAHLEPHPAAAGGGTMLTGVHVLLVDDDAEARESISAMLEQHGARVTAVGTAADALRALRSGGPDLLLSDIGMPEEDGYSLINKLRRLSPEDGGAVPAIALTAYAKSERARALAAGFQAHLAKPVDPTELVELIARLVASAHTPMARRAATGVALH